MASDDLFLWLNAIWTKERPNGTFPVFVAHRFLASDRQLANAARVLSKDLREPDLIFATWQALLPRADAAPRLTYPAAKKPAAAEALTLKMMTVLNARRSVVEEMQKVVTSLGRSSELYSEYGIEAPDAKQDDETANDQPRKRGKKAKPASGLLAMLE